MIVSSASDFVVLVYNAGRKKPASLSSCTVEPIAQSRTNFVSTWFFSTEFHLDAAGFYLQLSELSVCVVQRIARFENVARATDSWIVFVGRNRKQGGKKAHDTHSLHARNKNGCFFSIILIALGVFRTRGKRLSLWKTWIAICPLCVWVIVSKCTTTT